MCLRLADAEGVRVVLQKLRDDSIRLAVVRPPGSAAFSTRFRDMVAEERRGPDFGVFETRDEAIAWLARNARHPAQ